MLKDDLIRLACQYPSFVARFHGKYRRDADTGCDIWTGCRYGDGYPLIAMPRRLSGGKQRQVRAHRVAWAIAHPEVLIGECVCHHCDTPLCVRPEHLFSGTYADNHRDMRLKGREHVNRGADHPATVLKPTDIPVIRAMLQTGSSGPSIGRRFGVSCTTIYRIRDGRKWTHVE